MKQQDGTRKSNRWKWIFGVILAMLAVGIGAMVLWISNPYTPNKTAIEAMQGSETVTVTQKDWIEFLPQTKPTKGFIFYPGGLVEPESYAPLCEEIAEQGYLVVLIPMTANLAILSPNKAEEVVEAYDGITTWAIGGHSLGGVMACQFAAKHEQIRGIVLYAAYPQGDELSKSSQKVVSLYGSKDGVADLTKVTGADLGKQATWIEIAGGNHSYFGSYDLQKGDHPAEITPEVQRQQAVYATVNLLESLDQ